MDFLELQLCIESARAAKLHRQSSTAARTSPRSPPAAAASLPTVPRRTASFVEEYDAARSAPARLTGASASVPFADFESYFASPPVSAACPEAQLTSACPEAQLPSACPEAQLPSACRGLLAPPLTPEPPQQWPLSWAPAPRTPGVGPGAYCASVALRRTLSDASAVAAGSTLSLASGVRKDGASDVATSAAPFDSSKLRPAFALASPQDMEALVAGTRVLRARFNAATPPPSSPLYSSQFSYRSRLDHRCATPGRPLGLSPSPGRPLRLSSSPARAQGLTASLERMKGLTASLDQRAELACLGEIAALAYLEQRYQRLNLSDKPPPSPSSSSSQSSSSATSSHTSPRRLRLERRSSSAPMLCTSGELVRRPVRLAHGHEPPTGGGVAAAPLQSLSLTLAHPQILAIPSDVGCSQRADGVARTDGVAYMETDEPPVFVGSSLSEEPANQPLPEDVICFARPDGEPLTDFDCDFEAKTWCPAVLGSKRKRPAASDTRERHHHATNAQPGAAANRRNSRPRARKARKVGPRWDREEEEDSADSGSDTGTGTGTDSYGESDDDDDDDDDDCDDDEDDDDGDSDGDHVPEKLSQGCAGRKRKVESQTRRVYTVCPPANDAEAGTIIRLQVSTTTLPAAASRHTPKLWRTRPKQLQRAPALPPPPPPLSGASSVNRRRPPSRPHPRPRSRPPSRSRSRPRSHSRPPRYFGQPSPSASAETRRAAAITDRDIRACSRVRKSST